MNLRYASNCSDVNGKPKVLLYLPQLFGRVERRVLPRAFELKVVLALVAVLVTFSALETAGSG